MATRLLILFGQNNIETLNEKLLPYDENNYQSFKHTDITELALKRIKEKFNIADKDIDSIIVNDKIFNVLLDDALSKYFLNKNDELTMEEEEIEDFQADIEKSSYFYKDTNDKYHVFEYCHFGSKFDALEIRENKECLNGISPYMKKGEIDLNCLKSNERFSLLNSVVDLNGVWHDIECSNNEETIDELIKLADDIPEETKMTVIHYHY